MNRIGYVPLDAGLRAPGDRRRFPRYAKQKKVPIDLVSRSSDKELVVLSEAADVTYWSRVPRSSKLVFELIDSYLDVEPESFKARVRGIAKYALGRHERLELSYHESLRAMCRRADAVVCSTPEQQAKLRAYNSNVHPILDYHGDEVRTVKVEHSAGPEFHLLWEGMAENFAAFETIASVLAALSQKYSIVLHVVTDLSYKPLNGPIPRIPTRWLIDRVLPGVQVRICEWDKTALSALASICDIGVIPLFLDKGIYRNKPENKLLLLWRLGLPVLTAATPAYVRTMAEAGVDMTCDTPRNWTTKLEFFLEHPEAREHAARKGAEYVAAKHSDDARTLGWDCLFEAMGVSHLFQSLTNERVSSSGSLQPI